MRAKSKPPSGFELNPDIVERHEYKREFRTPRSFAYEQSVKCPGYALPSRYCESDRFAQIAWELFGKTEDRAEQVRAICKWIDQKLEYVPGSSDSRTSAWDVWLSRQGVCRDYTHLAIAFCRALSIPARYVGGYAAGLQPVDFHACFEAYLGGDWHLFDPTDDIPPEHIVVISRGRDATSAALTTIFGRITTAPVKVTCEVVPDLRQAQA